MQFEFDIVDNAQTFRCVAERSDPPWGHALLVKVFDSVGEAFASILFACDPEDENFAICQTYNTAQLVDAATKQLSAGLISNLQEAREAGLRYFVEKVAASDDSR